MKPTFLILCFIVAFATLAIPSSIGQVPALVNGDRLLQHLHELAQFGKNPQGGVSRVAYSDFDLQGRNYAMRLMREAGLRVSIDAAGNIVGRRDGSDATLPPLVTGSHIDSVPLGGNFDGCVGSLSAIEVAQVINESKIVAHHPLEFIIFQNEEEGLFGSRAISGDLAAQDLDNVSRSGKTIREGIKFIGGDPSQIETVKRKAGDIAAYLEYHIEQGPILDAEKVPIGVVEGIVGVNRWEVTVEGFANHAGTTPMDKRKDALLSAARFTVMVNQAVLEEPGLQVGTVGRINAEPNAVNVIAGKATLTLEIRDLDTNKIARIYDKIFNQAQAIGKLNNTTFQFKSTSIQFPAPADISIRKLIEESASALNLTTKSLRSGAGHDAQAIGRIAPIGMVFIPSRNGISHSPEEFSDAAAITNGANVYLQTFLKMDQSK